MTTDYTRNPAFSALTHPTADLERSLDAMRAEKAASGHLSKAPQWAKDHHDDTIRQIEAELQNRREELASAVRKNSAGAIVRALRNDR